MDWNLLIGAVIAIVSSSVGLIINYCFQTNHLKMKRKWELEDEQRRIKKELVFHRLDKLESYIEELARTYSNFHILVSVNDIDMYNSLCKKLDQSDVVLFDNLQYMYLVKYFHDEELENCFHSLIKSHADLMEVYKRYKQKMEDGDVFENNEFIKLISKIHIIEPYNNMIHKIDTLREKYYNL